MNKYVLFSPIGSTDPVRECYDGPMLHIVRHYRPRKVYLYFTKEMAKKEREVEIALKHFDIEIEKEITDIDNPYNFDIFANTFDKIFKRIQNENKDSKILINISSGTPQIKSALCLEVVSSHLNLTPIQVLTPLKSSNENVSHGGDINENLDSLMENGRYITENRCLEADILSYKRMSIKRNIISLVNQYEYRAALRVIEINKRLFSKDAIELIRYAMLRQNDNIKYNKHYYNQLFNETKDYKAKIACDYYCILKNSAKKGELSYFVLLLKPLAEYIANDYIGEFSETEAKKTLNEYYNKKTGKEYRPTFRQSKVTYNLEQYICIMESMDKPKLDIDNFKVILSQIDSRNELAHNLYREDDINPSKSLNIIKHLIHITYGNKVKESSLSLYENINRKIIELI